MLFAKFVEIGFTQGCSLPSLLKLAQWFWRRKFLNFVNEFLLLSPLGNGMALHLYLLEYPSPKDALCLVWLNWPNCSGEEDENVKNLRQN